MEVFRARLISGGGKKAQVVVHSMDDDGVVRSATRHVEYRDGALVGFYPNDDVIAINRSMNEAANHAVGVANGTLAFLKSSLDMLRKRKAKMIEAGKASKNQDFLTRSTRKVAASFIEEQIAEKERLAKLTEADLKEAELALAKVEREHPYPLYAEFNIN